jgi:hypothetical protein
MAIRFEQKQKLNALELVSVNDDAIDADNSDIAAYKETGDINKLKFLADKQPTIFLMNFELKGREAMLIKNAMLEGKDEGGNPQLAFGSWTFRIIKYTLKDIKNPADLPEDCSVVFKKDERGYVHDSILNKLDSLGILDELFGFYSRLALSAVKSNAKN